jgi:hypothetical protein
MVMKTNIAKTMMLLALVVLAASCNDRALEKKVAQLEDRITALEGGRKSPTAGTVPGITTSATTPSPVTTAPAAETKPEGPVATMEFTTVDHDFGTINEGDVVEHTYKFKNTGAAPLVIQSAQGSCGCTVPEWSKEPIPVGGTGFVKAKFDSNGKANAQNKTVTVTANTFPKQTVLRFKAMVTPKSVSGK